ncbi:MAG: hypothetical protein JNL21_15670 [Myxococcales bacterium]|nr:hypothetical protein [Myxococcales bacterium]
MSPRSSRDLDLGRVLAQPAWLTSLLLLLVNDHVLKGAGLVPSWLTGKLSDVAGLFVAPALLAILVRARTPLGLAAAHVAVGLGFTALELSTEINAAGEALYGALGLPFQQWSDPTDLLTLLVLPLAYVFARRVASHVAPPPRGVWARGLTAVGLLACAASTSTQHVGPEDAPESPDCSEPGAPYPCEAPLTEDGCDNGWDEDSDGAVDCADTDCSAACDALLEACEETVSGPFVDLSFDRSMEGSTLGQPSLTESNCLGADAPDDFLLLHVPEPGTLVLELPENHGVSVRSTCTDWRSELGCYDTGPTVEIPFPAAGTFTLVVEALDPLLAASFTVDVVEFRPAAERAP